MKDGFKGLIVQLSHTQFRRMKMVVVIGEKTKEIVRSSSFV
jgi:hypothetical protein